MTISGRDNFRRTAGARSAAAKNKQLRCQACSLRASKAQQVMNRIVSGAKNETLLLVQVVPDLPLLV
jgi:hypothetical protein